MVCLGLELRDGRLRQIHWAMAEPSGNDTNLYETCLMFTLKWKSTFHVQSQINLDGDLGDLVVVAIPAQDYDSWESNLDFDKKDPRHKINETQINGPEHKISKSCFRNKNLFGKLTN